uniref:Fibronectin type-III domain-containing protein n=1 Tax=Timema cristinae TaxID=61476 RepID=A0A7R9CE08_TIMCR|nr:unnamed protein product [Timema cristinae]
MPFTCWCHKLNLIGEIWQANLRDLNNVVAKLKGIFRNARKLKRQYKLHLEENFPLLPPNLYPIPVLTRWSSWFNSVEYISSYLTAIHSFLEEKKDSLSPQGQSLLELLTPDFLNSVEVQAVFVCENCAVITNPIVELQSKSAPKAHLLFARLEAVLTKCDLVSKGHFGGKVNLLLGALPFKKKEDLVIILKMCGSKSHMKLSKYVDSTGANKLFGEVRVLKALSYLFNPSNILSRSTPNIEQVKINFKVLPFFVNYDGDLSFFYIEMCKKLKVLMEESDGIESLKIENVLLGLKTDSMFSDFATKCLQALWLPISNADSEQYFSRLGRAGGYNFTTVSAKSSGSGAALLTGLKKYRKYGVVVQAFNEKGPGPTSNEVIAQTLEDGHIEAETKVTSEINTELHGLQKYSNYSIQVWAYTKIGDGVKSNPIFCVTDEDGKE